MQTSIILPDLSFKKLCSVNNAESSSKNKILWAKFSHEEIHEKYVNPLLSDLEYFELDFCDSVSVTKNLTSLIVHHSCSLKAPKQPKSDITDSNNRKYTQDCLITLNPLVFAANLRLIPGKRLAFPLAASVMTIIVPNTGTIAHFYVHF